ncbi:MAG: hypothetical protein JKY60_16820 [Kordiimonadaceae bacterium]|nr:hypothetical protein [Kordiimonadaceae bacterium]
MTTIKSFRLFAAVIVSTLSLTVAASAQQILTVDNKRVEQESAAFKDFRLQANDLTELIRARQQALLEGGAFTQQLAELEKKKTLIGNDKYQEDLAQIRQTIQRFQNELQIANQYFQAVKTEAYIQINRVQDPLLRQFIKDRKALIILPKSVAMANAAGLDITTELIEQLDEKISAVVLTKLPTLTAPQPAAANAAPAGN